MTPWFAASPFFHLLDFRFNEIYRFIRFEKDTRYYSMCIEKDLLGDWITVITNGRIKTKLGQTRKIAFTSYSDAFDHFCEMIQVRLKRQYHLKSYSGDDFLLLHLMVCIPTTTIEVQPSNTVERIPRTLKSKRVPSQMITPPALVQMGFAF